MSGIFEGVSDVAGRFSVTLFAGLEERTRERRTSRDYDPREAPTVGAVIESLGLATGAVGLVLVNGVHAGLDRVLAPGDEVALFPPLGGG